MHLDGKLVFYNRTKAIFMNVLIVEDELPASKQLRKLIHQIRPETRILDMIDSVDRAVEWLQANPQPDLLFLDIQLADGLSFDILRQTEVRSPIIFTTAYDQYTLKAFKLNSIDYLLKPIDPDELAAAIHKFESLYQRSSPYDDKPIRELMRMLSEPQYKERFIVKAGQQISYIPVSEIQYFFSENGIVFAKTAADKKHVIDYTLDQLSELLPPLQFFRINRKLISRIEAIRKISPYFNSRLTLVLHPRAGFDVIVSRDRVNDFKKWLDR